jgi:hypothetical protein
MLLKEILHLELPWILMEDNTVAFLGEEPMSGATDQIDQYLLALHSQTLQEKRSGLEICLIGR